MDQTVWLVLIGTIGAVILCSIVMVYLLFRKDTVHRRWSFGIYVERDDELPQWEDRRPWAEHTHEYPIITEYPTQELPPEK
jgi:hypothetical protein